MRYKVVKCPNCGKLQITTANKAYRCFRCGSTTSLEEARILLVTEDGEKAREFLKSLLPKEEPWFRQASRR